MFKDLITYKLAKGVTEQHLYAVAKDIVDNWMANLPGFISWEINKDADGNFYDVVSWESKALADAANEKMGDIPNGQAWFACYEPGTIKSQRLFQQAHFGRE